MEVETSSDHQRSPTFLYDELLKEHNMLVLSEGSKSCDLYAVFNLCPSIKKLALEIIQFCKRIQNNVSETAFHVLSKLTTLKILLQVLLSEKKVSYCREIFVTVFGSDPTFFLSLISIENVSLTMRFLLSEVLSLYICVSQRLSILIGVFEVMGNGWKNESFDLMLVLYVIDYLCIYAKENLCDDFVKFLCKMLSAQYFKKCLLSTDVKVQILVLRIYTKASFIKSNEKSRHVIYDNFDLIASFCKETKNTIIRNIWWKFLNSLFQFPGEGPIEKSSVIRASELLLQCVKPNFIDFTSDVFTTVAVNVYLKCLVWMSCDFSKFRIVILDCINGFTFIESISAEMFISLFIEEDEDLIDFLLLHLEIYCTFLTNDPHEKMEGFLSINPWDLFLELLLNLSFDFSVLNDWLVSNETRFLRYFVKFLKLTRLRWADFILSCEIADKSVKSQEACHELGTSKVLEACISTLIKLRNVIAKLHGSKLYPYSPEPLLKHLNVLEELFEGNIN